MSEFHNAFYTTCRKHDIEHPKWRKCPKCEEVISYSEEEVNDLFDQLASEAKSSLLGNYFIRNWWNQNKKK